jgi:type I restriction enzyme M protein
MIADTQLKSKVDALWDKLWSGGLANPLDAIEQLSFLLFLKQLDEREERRGQPYKPLFAQKNIAGPTGASCRPRRR